MGTETLWDAEGEELLAFKPVNHPPRRWQRLWFSGARHASPKRFWTV